MIWDGGALPWWWCYLGFEDSTCEVISSFFTNDVYCGTVEVMFACFFLSVVCGGF